MMVFQQTVRHSEVGEIRRQSSQMVLQAAQLVKKGEIYPLGTERFHGMPNFPSHDYRVYATSNPVAAHANPNPRKRYLDKRVNRVGLAFNNDDLHACSHSGTHVDTLAHVTLGEDCHWYNGFTYRDSISEHGVIKADASSFLPFFTRGVMLDIAALKGVPCLEHGSAITAADLEGACARQNLALSEGDVVLLHTGFADHYPTVDNSVPDRAGINEQAARWLAQKKVYAVGSDTESLEQLPSAHPDNPYIVHTVLLIESGVYIMENVLLGKLAADRIYEFLFVALPLTNRGATASMINPIAVV